LKILHITSDWKWTGPAEPMLRLALAQREAGHEVALACPAPPHDDRSLAGEARSAGLPPVLVLERARGLRPFADRADVRALRSLLEEGGFAIVHAWHTRDHLLALRAARSLRRSGYIGIVRSYRRAEAIPNLPWNRWLFGPGTDGLLCVSPGSAARNAPLRGGRPIAGAFGAVDLERFMPRAADPGVRKALGLGEEHRVVGIVARVQRHRRFDLLLEAASRLFAVDPGARLLVVGRGSARHALAELPAERLGIADRVVFAGYRDADYAAVLRAMDVFTFLVPGSDGTCRALLEAAACGIPAVTTRRGALPEIVRDGETGFLSDEDPAALAHQWLRLLADPPLRARMGSTAAAQARERFAPARFAAAVEALYAEACAAARCV
jgi:glycosyltransferase involved in cell wall biosynthesis